MSENDILIYDKEYHLWRDGEYIGTATYVDDSNIGDAFLKSTINGSGELCYEVHNADKWKLVDGN